MFGRVDDGCVVGESIDARFGAPPLVRATDCAVAAPGERWGAIESDVKATMPRTAADIAPAVTVLATL